MYSRLKAYYWDALPESKVEKYFKIRDQELDRYANSNQEDAEEMNRIASVAGSVVASHRFDMSGARADLKDEVITAGHSVLESIDNYKVLMEYGIKVT